MIKKLAKRTALGKSIPTDMLVRLLDDCYLIRRPSKRDRRMILINLKNKTIQSKVYPGLATDERVVLQRTK